MKKYTSSLNHLRAIIKPHSFIANRYQNRLYQIQSRNIYVKDKDLDKSNYKSTELDQLKNYVKYYMQDDPKNLSEEEIQKLLKQFEEELKNQQADQTQTLAQGTSTTSNAQDPRSAGNPPKIVDPAQLKELFDKMIEIDSDPQSKRAQDYYKRLEELERNNPNKKKSEIIIKTMKRGRTLSQEKYSLGGVGHELTQEEKVFQRKFIDWRKYQFPEVNPVQVKAKSGGKEVSIANYRYPSQLRDRKGIIYYIHGYGDYCQRYAYLGKQFAEAGYDFVGMDQKGFGHSEGKRAIIDSEQSMIEEHLNYFDKIDQTFGGKDVPKFTFGVSLGGMISLKLNLARPDWFKGQGLVVPYLELQNDQDLQKYLPLAKIIDKIYPSYRLAMNPAIKGKVKNIPPRYVTQIKDPLLEVEKIPVHNIVVNYQTTRSFKQQIDQVKTPFLMILGGQDTAVSNRASRQFFEKAPIQDKDIITYDDANHFIIMDNEYVPLMVKDLIGWYNTHC